MKIALWNASGLDNLGDFLLDQVNRTELGRRIPGSSFVTYSPWLQRDGVKKLAIDQFGGWSGEGQFDTIVIGGGAILMGPPFSHPGLQNFFLGPRPGAFRDSIPIIWNAVCSDSRIASPDESEWSEYVRSAAERLSLITVRNPRTYDFLRTWGVSKSIKIVPDPAILVTSPRPIRHHRIQQPIKVGWLVARPEFPPEFIEFMRATALDELPNANPMVVRLTRSAAEQVPPLSPDSLSQFVCALASGNSLEVAGLKNMYGDWDHARAMVRSLGSSARVTAVDILSGCEPFVGWVKSLDCLIASRLHHCIVAVAAGVPVLALDPYYSPISKTSKLREFMSSCGLEQFYFAITDAEFLKDGGGDILERAIRLQPELTSRSRLRYAANTHFDHLANVICGLPRKGS